MREAIARDEHRNVPIAEAQQMGAMALFGEKYGDEVRVIRYGDSVELCGGTHVDNSGNIGMIKIVSESSIAAGIRRIEAITGEAVENAMDELTDTLHKVAALFNNAPDVEAAVKKAVAENADLHKQVEDYFKERVAALSRQLLEKATTTASGVKIVEMQGVRLPDVVKNVAFNVRNLSPENTVFVGATKDAAEKPLLTVMVTENLVKTGLNASQIVRTAAKKIQGGGGGQPGFAQAGGKNVDGLTEAFAEMMAAIKA